MRKKTLITFIATGALIVGLSACSAGTSEGEQVGDTNSDTSIDISPTISGDESVDLGDIDTGEGNSTN